MSMYWQNPSQYCKVISLQLNKLFLIKRRECKKGTIPWYSLQWPRIKEELDIKDKILIISNIKYNQIPIVNYIKNKGVQNVLP